MSGPLRNLAYIDGYRLYDALKDGSPATFTVGTNPVEYTAKFHGTKIGADNFLEVTDGDTSMKWGWGWHTETVFHCLHDIEAGNFTTPFFRYRSYPDETEGEWC